LLFASVIAGPGFALAADAQRLPPGPQPTLYFPERNDWQHKKPEEVGMDSARLDQAVKSAIANENPLTKDMAFWFEGNGNNIIYIDWENDIVAVVRWINPGPSLNDVVGKMLASIKTPAQKDALAK
jgi:hypothetical protein